MDEELEQLINEANAEREALGNGEDIGNEDSQDENQDNYERDEDQGQDDQDSSNDSDNGADDDNNDNDDDEDGNSSDDNDNNDDAGNNTTNSFEPQTLIVNGHKVTINSQEELMAFATKGAQAFNDKPNTPSIEEEIISQGKLTKDDLKLLIDAKNGDPKAIAKLAQQSNVDLLDVSNDDANDYISKFEPTIATDVDRVAADIMKDTELAGQFQSLSSSLPDSFIKNITANAKDLSTFAEHVKSGFAQEIIPEAIKLSYQGMDFSQAYVQVGTRIAQAKAESNKEQKRERIVSDKEKTLRKKASDNSNQNRKGKNLSSDMSEDEVWNLSDEEFEALTSGKK